MKDRYPRGKLCDNDQGVTAIKIGVVDKTVIVEFQEGTNWIGLDKKQALAMGEAIIAYAESIT